MPSRSWIEVPIDQEVEGVPTEGYSPFFFPPEGAKLVFEFTQESFLKVLSALINGAALTYPNEWLQVVWDFLRNVEYPVSLCDEIAAAILTCEDVQLAIATLIATPGPVQDAITDLVVTSPEINEYITNVYERLSPGQIIGVIAGGDCDFSVVAGRAIAIVERLDTNNTDALEILEVGTNDEERLSQILSAFPGFGLLPLDELLDFAQDVLEDFAENYAAASTFDRKDAMAEQIYCLMQESDDCSVTWQQLFDFVKTKIPAAPFDIAVTIGDILQFVGDGDFNNDDLLFYGMMLLQLATITASQNFNGLTAPLLSAITRDALPSSRWEEWDDCAPPDPDCVDYAETEGGWMAGVPSQSGTYHPGEGWGGTQYMGTIYYAFSLVHSYEDKVLTRLTITLNQAREYWVVGTSAGTYYSGPGARSSIDIDITNAPMLFPLDMNSQHIALTFGDSNVDADFRMIEACFYED